MPHYFDPDTRPAPRADVVVRDVTGLRWRVLDIVPDPALGGPGRRFEVPSDPRATQRCFIARDRATGRKLVRVIQRIPADDWVTLDRWTLLAQLEGATPPERGRCGRSPSGRARERAFDGRVTGG